MQTQQLLRFKTQLKAAPDKATEFCPLKSKVFGTRFDLAFASLGNLGMPSLCWLDWFSEDEIALNF